MGLRITPRAVAVLAALLTLAGLAYMNTSSLADSAYMLGCAHLPQPSAGQRQLFHEPLPPAPPARVTCERCEVSPGWCESFGERNMDLVAAYEGSGDRLRRVLAKAMRGEPITYGIIGGSLSRGHGCECVTFHRQIFDWWNETFPHPDNVYVDGSVGARGSNYFKFCHIEHLPQDADLIVLELSINDDPVEGHAKNIESILRATLDYPKKPAVIITASFSLMGKMAMGGDVHLPVAQYYDVPVINLRHALLPIIQKRPEAVEDFFVVQSKLPNYKDLLHLSGLGHYALAESTIALLERQKCLVENAPPRKNAMDGRFVGGESYDIGLPRLSLMSDKWSDTAHARVDKPSCMTIDSEAHPLTPARADGWEQWLQPHTTKRYWRATEPGARISFAVYLAEGHVMLYYLKSKKMSLGRVRCWLNDDEKAAVIIDGYWEDQRSIGQFTNIREGKPLSPGNYTLNCENMERHYGKEEGRGTTFLIIAVLTV